jgi:hypothetical protein
MHDHPPRVVTIPEAALDGGRVLVAVILTANSSTAVGRELVAKALHGRAPR